MITENLMNFYRTGLGWGAGGTAYGGLPLRDVNGNRAYTSNKAITSGFPYGSRSIATIGGSTAITHGFSIGRDGTPASIYDYNLKDTINSGVSISLMATFYEGKNINDYFTTFDFSITNTSNNTITIREIGYKTQFECARIPTSPATETTTFLLDRTVLEEPLTLESKATGIIHYKIGFEQPIQYKNNIKLVSWEFGTDEEIAAMIDAAHEGLIDLEEDGGWKIGDTRAISIGSFGNGTTIIAAQQAGLMISSFKDYNNCGCVMQVDWKTFLGSLRMHSSSSNLKYETCEMTTVTLPSLINALPEWFSSRLLPFDILVKETSSATTVITIPNNKLALRSPVEVANLSTSQISSHYDLEGERIDGYLTAENVKKYSNFTSLSSNSTLPMWLRSLQTSTSFFIVYTGINSGTLNSSSATSTNYFAPFGCL